MSNLPEITSLFTMLASNLQSLDPMAQNEDESLYLTISNLNRSLNLTETPPVTVLNTALSLMCFTAPQVYDKIIEYTVNTIITVLSSSIQCKTLTIDKDEFLHVGGTISPQHCTDLISACAEIIEKLEARGDNLSLSLLHTVIKVVLLASNFQYTPDLTPIIDACSKLIHNHVKIKQLPLRLSYWYIDPNILKSDISQILQEITKRPLLNLSIELYERPKWRNIITCLSLSPSIFIQTRAMLHNWFLQTGIPSILKLQTELVSMVFDISSQPMKWDLPMEIATNLPFPHTYFPHNLNILTILTGPLSCENFKLLVHTINKNNLYTISKQDTINISMVDHTSIWSMIMNFPNWFYFASILLLCNETFQDCTYKSNYHSEAAQFLAWILHPYENSHKKQLINHLSKLSKSKNKAIRTLNSWLQEFHAMCNNNKNNNKTYKSRQQSTLLRKIPLGIMTFINDEESQLLLHYATIGTHVKQTEEYSRKEAIDGVCIVFELTDLTENVTDSIFESEELGLDFLYLVKQKTGTYLFNCIKRLIQIKIHEDQELVKDLCKRLVRWRNQGRDVFSSDRELDQIIHTLNQTIM